MEVIMPRLSDSMEEGTILQWLKSVGDEVALGDALVEIETDKANMVYEADSAGTLLEIVAPEGEARPIGEVIARIGSAGEAQGAEPAAPAPALAPALATAAVPTARPERDGAPRRPKASPLARRVASELGIDLSSLAGSGPGGRIVKADVEGTVAQRETAGDRGRPETAKGEVETLELTKLQQTIARRMAESKATAPHFYLETIIDMSRAVEARARLKQRAGDSEVVPSFNDFVVKACAIALREFPRANGAYRDGGIETYARVNVGVAVAAHDALVVPTIFDADRKGLREIATEGRALAARVRDGQITPPELSGGTFTVSNLGMFGINSFQAVINPPQAAILAVGSIERVPLVRDSAVVPGERMAVNLACDHRILYGAEAAQFLARVRSLLEEPVALAM